MSAIHRCPAAGCTVELTANRLACTPHWHGIPPEVRELLGKAREQYGRGSRWYRDAIIVAVSYVKGTPDEARRTALERFVP